ncbi:MAG: hypothetical protein J6K82_01100 [Alphaproteobacteria bacterium]|nr:hypothetical protein [Alphaproteobacteria bacterium]
MSPIIARPPTSAVDGRNTKPARRTAGLLLILADETRELRPTVFTAASSPLRADAFVRLPETERVITFVRLCTLRVLAVDGVAGAPVNTRDTVERIVFLVSFADGATVVCLDVVRDTAVRESDDERDDTDKDSDAPDDGTAREATTPDAKHAGAQTIIAKIQVDSFLIFLGAIIP